VPVGEYVAAIIENYSSTDATSALQADGDLDYRRGEQFDEFRSRQNAGTA